MHIYQIHTGSQKQRSGYPIICMMYNKTLFEEHGWKVPTTHSELVSLCRQVREEEPGLVCFGDAITKLQESIDADAFDIADKEVKNNDVTDNLPKSFR